MTLVMVRDHPHMTSALNGLGGRVNARIIGIWVNSILTMEGSENFAYVVYGLSLIEIVQCSVLPMVT